MRQQNNLTNKVQAGEAKEFKGPQSLKQNASLIYITVVAFTFFMMQTVLCGAQSFEFPAIGWHRGDVSSAQENSRKAIEAALLSPSPNIEVDVLDFVDAEENRVGLLAHDYEMDRIVGIEGKFSQYNNLSSSPLNSANPDLTPEPLMSIVELFELILNFKEQGIIPIVSLDLKEEGDTGKAFGVWLGELIKKYGFQKHVFASSFFKSNVIGVKESCPECMIGGLVFNDHYALKHLDYHHTSLDLTKFSKLTFFLGFLGKEEFPHDFVLIQDDIFFSQPDLVEYWKDERKVKFVGVFVYSQDRPYTDEEWRKLENIDWMELNLPQIAQKLNMKQN